MSCMQIKYFGMLSTYANLYLFISTTLTLPEWK